MDENRKRRFDAISTLWEACGKRRSERRTYEMKLALALWTALALGIAGLATTDLQGLGWPLPLAAGILSVVLCSAHYSYLVGVGQRHDEDLAAALHYEGEMHKLTETTPPPEVATSSGNTFGSRVLSNWSRSVQFAVTCVLAIAFVGMALIVVLGAGSAGSREPDIPEVTAPLAVSDGTVSGFPMVAVVSIGTCLAGAAVLIKLYQLWRDRARLSLRVVLGGSIGGSSGVRSLVLDVIKRGIAPIRLQSGGFRCRNGDDYLLFRDDEGLVQPWGTVRKGSNNPGHGQVFRVGMTIRGIHRHLHEGSMTSPPVSIWVEDTTCKRRSHAVPRRLMREISSHKKTSEAPGDPSPTDS